MSIKDLFNKNRNYLPQTNNKELLVDVESSKNVSETITEKNTFVPQIDYSEPTNFAKYGSAYLYYKSAIERVYDFFPYDGSKYEITKFTNSSLPHERYIFDNLYPRTNGYANFDGSSYISFKGGPHTAPHSTLGGLFRDAGSSKRSQANLYETDIFQSDNKPSDYSNADRESNLKCDFTNGVTVEFWLKAPSPSSNTKQTIFHLTNSSGGDELTIFLSGTTGSPFHATLTDSSTSIFSAQQVGVAPTTSSIASWGHYALTFKSASAGITTKLYVNGSLDESKNLGSVGVGTLEQKGTLGYIATGSVGGYLSGSIDEFRFWKAERDAYQIGTNYFSQVGGGANTDISNASLGVYYKFNEGTTGVSSLDEIVLDYSGRLTNGTWSGNTSRTLESAIVESAAAPTEYKDPIIYSEHPSVSSLKTDLESKGNFYDRNNPTKFINYLPSWVLEEDQEEKESQLEKVSHIIGAYFDKLFLQIQAVGEFKQPLYTSSSYKPLTFAKSLPQSLGLYTPEIFVDSDIINTISNKSENFNFESKLEDTKNLIYLNLYNNLASIFKSKGTEKSIKGVLRCFYIDDQIVKLNTYTNKARYELRNNLEQTTKINNFINLNNTDNVNAVIYQKQNPSDTTNTTGYISGSEGSGYEFAYGATVEADITFPYFNDRVDTIDRTFTDVSLFGLVSASVDTPSDTTFLAADNTNFQVFAVRDSAKSKNVYFKITSSISPHPLPQLTSSIFFGAYNNQDWNLSVSVIPNKSGSLKYVTGSDTYDYTFRFEGYNTLLGDTRDQFSVEQVVSKTIGENFLKSAKRVYAGAYRQNITGSSVAKSDVLVSGVRYWIKNIDSTTKIQHALDFDNIGVTKAYENISSLDTSTKDLDVLNHNTLALSWEFGNVTGSDSSGNFYVTDFSSGSALIRENYGWVGDISGYQHSGYGYGFATSSSGILDKRRINMFKFTDPEKANSSDMVRIVSENEELFGIPEDVVSYHHVLEKSMYSAVSDEMLKFFAGAADFHNLIGEPVNRYRASYKALEKLRQAFFLRVDDIKEVEKYIEYYKWFDDSLGDIIKQLVPASSVVSENVFDVVEGHVLERNKYQSKFPTMEFKVADPETPALGIGEKTLDWQRNHHPVTGLQTENSEYWQKRAEREGSLTISSGDTNIDQQRDTIIETADKHNTQPAPTLSTPANTTYSGQTYVLRKLSLPYKLKIDRKTNPPRIFKGGTNFEVNKNFGFHRIALHPVGPVNTEDGVYVPANVLLGIVDDLVGLKDTTDPSKTPNKKIKRNIKVQSGREWEDGIGYKNIKSDIAFPFNIVSSSVKSGYNKSVTELVESGVEIVNVHNDVYGSDMEKPMQGPFTEYAVGGLQYRHVALNKGSDNYLTRPEGWKILLGSNCSDLTGAIGMVGADYPYPEANDVGVNPYPMTGAQKAFLYRDMVAKRPVNIRNIHHTTGSTILGNYNHNYDVVHSVGAYSNPRQFIENQPTLPTNTFSGDTRFADSVRTILSIERGETGHFDLIEDYSVGYLHSSSGESIIISRFGAPGGIETMTKGYQDFKSSEMSVYNAMNARNLTVRRPFQGVDSAIVSETTGIRPYDIHGQAFGLMNLATRPSARFFRDSTLVTAPGTADDAFTESPSFHRVHRNNKIVATNKDVPSTQQKYDNLNIQHQIPRSDRQYSWITSSITNTDSTDPRYAGFMQVNSPLAPYYEITGNYYPFFDYVTSTETSVDGVSQNTTRLNLLVIDPTGSEQNVLGAASIAPGLKNTASDPKELNALLIRRGDTYGWNWRATRQQDHPILRIEKSSNEISINDEGGIQKYSLRPVSYTGRPVLINIYKTTRTTEEGNTVDSALPITLKASYNNYKIGFNHSNIEDAAGLRLKDRITPFNQMINMINNNEDYQLNWVSYSENIFPSQRNAFSSSVTFRDTYDNEYWRDDSSAREGLGNSLSNSFGVILSQSSWVLDAVPDFLTRQEANVYAINRDQGGGELQNTYFHIFKNPATITNDQRISALTPGALYARKHLIPTYRSVVSPTGVRIAETGSASNIETDFVEVFGGEAAWTSAEKAGIVNIDGETPTFVSEPSQPWFNNYADYKSELKLISKDYSIVPEFRISEKVSQYSKAGKGTNGLTDTFEIVGTSHNSSDTSFYKDYSNTEFLKHFSDVADQSETTPKEIRLVCKAITRLNPYKGFYPAQRTADLVEQFGKSYEQSFAVSGYDKPTTFGRDAIENSGSLLRPLFQPLFAPGILYNTIKSGLSVDFPVVSSAKKVASNAKLQLSSVTDLWVLTGRESKVGNSVDNTQGYNGGSFWDKRLPFETILEPSKYMSNISIYDIEPHPSASLDQSVAASLAAPSSDKVYDKMSDNFFAEIADFFLKDSEYTTLKSGVIEGELNFKSGSVYGARLKMRRSTTGPRTYEHDYDATGLTSTSGWFGREGLKFSSSFGLASSTASVTIPQDPKDNPNFKETFTMYSRPSAFGPAISGRTGATISPNSGALDSLVGCNWAFTPPYYHGESWADLVFRPDHTKTYSLEEVLAEIEVNYLRVDPGSSTTRLMPAEVSTIYSADNINANAMQLDSCLNIFGVEEVPFEETNTSTLQTTSRNTRVGKRWVIQPKAETPMLNFNDEGVNPVKFDDVKTLPVFGSASVPRGMWHQFGNIPETAAKGIFLEIGDIPTNWLKFHYSVLNENSIYNNRDSASYGAGTYQTMNSLTDLMNFEDSSVRLGELKESQTIREAIVAIPYSTDLNGDCGDNINGQRVAESKKFFSIPRERIQAAMDKGTIRGDSDAAAGDSIRDLIENTKKYVLPPQFDFVSNPDIDPLAMYFFEFEHEFDKDDLSYIWQNVAPRDYKKMEQKIQYAAHTLSNSEMLQPEDIIGNKDLRWMVFKVKQRGMSKYKDKIYPQIGNLGDKDQIARGYDVSFNWPYDYISLVEMINIDAEVLMTNEVQKQTTATKIKMTKIPKNIDRAKVQNALEDKIIADNLNTVGEME